MSFRPPVKFDPSLVWGYSKRRITVIKLSKSDANSYSYTGASTTNVLVSYTLSVGSPNALVRIKWVHFKRDVSVNSSTYTATTEIEIDGTRYLTNTTTSTAPVTQDDEAFVDQLVLADANGNITVNVLGYTNGDYGTITVTNILVEVIAEVFELE